MVSPGWMPLQPSVQMIEPHRLIQLRQNIRTIVCSMVHVDKAARAHGAASFFPL